MYLQPKGASSFDWIDTSPFPPGGLIGAAVHLAMVTSAEGDRKLVADLAAERWGLCKPQVMSVGGTTAAH